MTNLEISWVLEEIADLLEIKGESNFKVRAYRKAVRIIQALDEEIEELYQKKKLLEIEGIGTNLAKKIEELLTTGECQTLNRLREEIPSSLRELLSLPGIGPKTISRLYQELGITDLKELEEKARSRKIRELKGFSSKSESNILHAIEVFKSENKRVPLGVAFPVSLLFKNQLQGFSLVEKIETAGSLRRCKETVGDIDFVLAAKDNSEELKRILSRHPYIKEVLENNDAGLKLLTNSGIKLEFLFVEPPKFYLALFYATGSKTHLSLLQDWSRRKGIEMREDGLWEIEGNKMVPVFKEDDIYAQLGLEYIPPELREGKKEIELAAAAELPPLLQMDEIKGDLHIHTDWSDGLNSIREMVEAAKKKGYRFLAVTDHSVSLSVANGLSVARLQKQREMIDTLNKTNKDIKVLCGTEVDILKDGSLDYEDEVLKNCDVVIASVHTAFKMGKEEMTERIIKAIRHPLVNIIGHPTGRILGRRPAYEVDLERIIDEASSFSKILEINSAAERLDLGEEGMELAKQKGVLFALDSDAHDTGRLDDLKYGAAVCRRAYLTAEDIVNTREVDELLNLFAEQRRKFS